MSRTLSVVVLLAASLLAGCGNSGPAQNAGAPPTEKAIYMSASDCANGGKLNADVCSTLIERAVKIHEQTSERFKGVRSCEEASGPDRCERDMNGAYRMRLQAFLFEFGSGIPPKATPLYPSIEGKVGFRDTKKNLVAALDDNMIVSQQSLQVAYENSKIGKYSRR